MLLATVLLSWNILFYLPSFQSNLATKIDDYETQKCLLSLNCLAKSNMAKQKLMLNNLLAAKPNKKTCKDEEGKVYQEGEEMIRDGSKFICKDGEFVERPKKDSEEKDSE